MFRSRRKSFQYKLRNFIWPQSGVLRAWRYLMHRLARMKASPHKLALGFAAGAFVSFTPFIGFHFILAALVAFVVRGNLIASAVGTVVGNPITFPFIWLASYNLGARLLGQPLRAEVDISPPDGSAGLFGAGPLNLLAELWHSLEPLIVPMLLGGIPLGALCAAICYGIVKAALQQLKLRRARASAAHG